MLNFRLFASVALAASFALPIQAAELVLPAPSPKASVMQRVGTTDITVTYSSPGVKGRKVFGDLVKLGKLWRTGANAATTIEFSTPVKVGGTPVPAGKYSIFSTPGKGKSAWQIHINSVWKQGGTRNYDAKKNVVNMRVNATKIPARERMTFLFADTTDTSTRLDLEWATVRVSLPITVDTQALAAKGIAGSQAAMARELISAGRYLAKSGDTKAAMTHYDASLLIQETWMATWLKAELVAKGGDKKTAYALAKRAHELGLKADYFFWQKNVEAALAKWKP